MFLIFLLDTVCSECSDMKQAQVHMHRCMCSYEDIQLISRCRNLELNTIYTCRNYDVMPCAYQYWILVNTWRCEQLVEPERWHLCSDMAICQS